MQEKDIFELQLNSRRKKVRSMDTTEFKTFRAAFLIRAPDEETYHATYNHIYELSTEAACSIDETSLDYWKDKLVHHRVHRIMRFRI